MVRPGIVMTDGLLADIGASGVIGAIGEKTDMVQKDVRKTNDEKKKET